MQAKAKAIALLARREHTRLELSKKLKARGYPSNEIEQALEWLVQKGYLSEARFVESFVRYRISAGFGPLRIKKECLERGIPSGLLASDEGWQTADWIEIANTVLQRRFGAAAPAYTPEFARQARFLSARGFTTEQIYQVLR